MQFAQENEGDQQITEEKNLKDKGSRGEAQKPAI